MDFDDVLEAIGGLYEAATDAAMLPGLGGRIARLVRAESALLFTARKADAGLLRRISMTENFDARSRAAYDAHFHQRNEWFQRGARLPSPVVVMGGELIDYADFERTEFCNDWCKPIGIYHTLGSTVPMGGDAMVAMGIHRGPKDDSFTESERGAVRTLLPHLARGLQIADRLGTAEQRQALGDEALFELGIGVVLVDVGQRIVFANRIADHMIAKSRWLTASAGRLRAIHPASSEAFEAALNVAGEVSIGASLSAGGVVRLRDPLSNELSVLVTPFRSAALAGGNAAIAVLFSDPDARRTQSPGAIAAAFGLTPAEGALVAALVNGKPLAVYASEAGISFHTARAQLRAVFEKTEVTRQPDLVAKVLSNLAISLAGHGSFGRPGARPVDNWAGRP